MQVTSGPDGFIATSDIGDYSDQALLTEYLHQRQIDGDAVLARVLSQVRKQLSKREQVALVRTIHRRIGWIAEHQGELVEPRRWQGFLSQLAYKLYSPKLPFEAEDIAMLLDSHRQHAALWWFGPEELLVAFVETHDIPADLAAALRRYQAELKGDPGSKKFQNQSSYQVASQHVHMLLWHDENDALDPSRCWSKAIRGDVRNMTGARRAHWKALLRHVKGNAPAKPPVGWLRKAEQHLTETGHREFFDRFDAWFVPFRSDKPQPLSVAGSHILRGLLRYAALIDDSAIAPMALRLLDAKWKAKRNVEKAMVALVPVIERMPLETGWPAVVRLQQSWGTASGQIEELLKKIAAELGVPDHELRARALLKVPPSLDEHVDKFMDRLKAAKFIIGLDPRAR